MDLSLYRAFSVLQSFQGKDNVRIVWIPLRSGEAHLSGYERFVQNFDDLPQEARFHLKGYIDEFFTADELEALKGYLAEKRGCLVEVEPLAAPLSFSEKDKDSLIPLRLNRQGQGRFIRIEKTREWDLPFDVAALYDL
ncbi:MAG: hypothetical protein JMJ93_02505 [Synergistaceae bacterium]|jgi:hypothetical protein|nr:hypothetical protein [Synergistaceae bacterium]